MEGSHPNRGSDDLSRRGFLKGSGAALVAAGVVKPSDAVESPPTD